MTEFRNLAAHQRVDGEYSPTMVQFLTILSNNVDADHDLPNDQIYKVQLNFCSTLYYIPI